MMGLRLAEGIEVDRFVNELGRQPAAALNPKGLALMIDLGFITLDSRHLKATVDGRQRLNSVLEQLLP